MAELPASTTSLFFPKPLIRSTSNFDSIQISKLGHHRRRVSHPRGPACPCQLALGDRASHDSRIHYPTWRALGASDSSSRGIWTDRVFACRRLSHSAFWSSTLVALRRRLLPCGDPCLSPCFSLLRPRTFIGSAVIWWLSICVPRTSQPSLAIGASTQLDPA